MPEQALIVDGIMVDADKAADAVRRCIQAIQILDHLERDLSTPIKRRWWFGQKEDSVSRQFVLRDVNRANEILKGRDNAEADS